MKKEGVLILISALVLYHAAVSSGETSAGRRFAIGFPRHNLYHEGLEELSISIANYESSNINYSVTALGFNCTGTFSSFTAKVTIPLSFQVASADERNKGILVEATGDVYVHGLSHNSVSSDSYLALPCLAMPVHNYEYFAISYNVHPKFRYPATILVVACDDATSVLIGTISIILNSMETYLMSDSTTDLTGTRITSSKPLSVFSGVDCTNVPINIGYCDHLVEQVPPTVTWGSRFLVSSLNGRNSSQLIRVLSARTANVTVTCNTAISVSQFQLISGSFQTFEIPVNSYCCIESTGPVLVAQYAYGRSADNIGDPFMMIIPPTEQYINRHIFETYENFSNFSSHFTIYVSSEFFRNDAKIFLNNDVIPNWQPVPCSSESGCGYIARMTVDPGVYRIQHQNISATIGVSVYGFAASNSYGMPVGMGLSPIQVIIGPPVDLFVINNGSSAVFSCDTLTVPDLNGSWTFVNSSGAIIDIITNTKYSIVSDRNDSRFGELTVMSVTYEDRGVYTCTAVNNIGAVNASASLTVHARPIIRNFSSLTEVHIGSPVVLVCETTGYPLPVILWSFNGEKLNTSARMNVIEFSTASMNAISSNVSELLVMYTSLSTERVNELGDLGMVSLLLFEETVRGDTGDYVCTATNMLPQTTTLSVESGNIPLVILEPALIQFCLMCVDRCQQWVAEDGRQKLNTLSEALSVNVEERCQCGFSVSNVLNPTFHCFPESENAVTYRAEVSSTVSTSSSEIVNHIENWLTDGALVTFDFVTIPINSSCQVELSSNTDQECNGSTTALVPTFPVAAVGGAVVGVVILLIVIIGFIIVVYIWLHIERIKRLQLGENIPSGVEMNVAVASSNVKEGEYETIDNFQDVISKLRKYEDVKFPPTTSPNSPPTDPEYEYIIAGTVIIDTSRKVFNNTDCPAYGVTRTH